jgi:hypothetical protein
MVQLEVRHLLGSHFETWYGWTDAWQDKSDNWIDHKKRLRVLNREYRRLQRAART